MLEAAYPWIERRLPGHHARLPARRPARPCRPTSIEVTVEKAFYFWLLVASGNDVIGYTFASRSTPVRLGFRVPVRCCSCTS